VRHREFKKRYFHIQRKQTSAQVIHKNAKTYTKLTLDFIDEKDPTGENIPNAHTPVSKRSFFLSLYLLPLIVTVRNKNKISPSNQLVISLWNHFLEIHKDFFYLYSRLGIG
jgi:hypothetical protein